MTRLYTKILLGTGLVTALGFTAIAAPGKMQNLDLNGDSVIDMTEFLTGADQRFTEMDADANGQVTKDEKRAFREAKRDERAAEKFAKADTNGDGAVSDAEYEEARAQKKANRQMRHDINEDGVIDDADKELRKERRQERKANRDDRKQERGDRQRFNPDANDDGVVDRIEHTAAAEHMFAKMDRNEDGVLSEDEMKRRKRKGDRKQRGLGR